LRLVYHNCAEIKEGRYTLASPAIASSEAIGRVVL
jgi:hypothetical protein